MSKSAANKFRGPELAKIHIARTELGLSEDVYRAMVSTVSGGETDSAGKLTWQQRRDLLDLFREKGWQPRHTGTPAGSKPSRPLADFPEARMCRGMWIELHQLYRAGAAKAVQDPSERALNRFVKRMTQVEDLHWLERNGRVTPVIEALKAWIDRSRQQCFDTWLIAYRCPVGDVLRALLIHCACELDTGKLPNEEWRPVLGEPGWEAINAYADYLRQFVQ
jgi:phage gp16-like protein